MDGALFMGVGTIAAFLVVYAVLRIEESGVFKFGSLKPA